MLGAFIFIAPRAGQLVKSMRRIVGIIGRVTAHSARPDLVLATISSMVAAVIVLALKFTFGSSS